MEKREVVQELKRLHLRTLLRAASAGGWSCDLGSCVDCAAHHQDAVHGRARLRGIDARALELNLAVLFGGRDHLWHSLLHSSAHCACGGGETVVGVERKERLAADGVHGRVLADLEEHVLEDLQHRVSVLVGEVR